MYKDNESIDDSIRLLNMVKNKVTQLIEEKKDPKLINSFINGMINSLEFIKNLNNETNIQPIKTK